MITKFKLFEYDYQKFNGLNSLWSNDEITIHFKDVLNYLDKNNIPVQYVDPNSLKHLLIKTKRDPIRVENSELKYPIIVVMENGKFTFILDGQHRLVKALKHKLDKVKIRILDLDCAPNDYKKIFARL